MQRQILLASCITSFLSSAVFAESGESEVRAMGLKVDIIENLDDVRMRVADLKVLVNKNATRDLNDAEKKKMQAALLDIQIARFNSRWQQFNQDPAQDSEKREAKMVAAFDTIASFGDRAGAFLLTEYLTVYDQYIQKNAIGNSDDPAVVWSELGSHYNLRDRDNELFSGIGYRQQVDSIQLAMQTIYRASKKGRRAADSSFYRSVQKFEDAIRTENRPGHRNLKNRFLGLTDLIQQRGLPEDSEGSTDSSAGVQSNSSPAVSNKLGSLRERAEDWHQGK